MSGYLGFDCFVCLCICDLVFLFCCLFVYFCDLVFSLLLGFFCFAGTARLSQYSHISLLENKEIRRQHLYRLDPKSTLVLWYLKKLFFYSKARCVKSLMKILRLNISVIELSRTQYKFNHRK